MLARVFLQYPSDGTTLNLWQRQETCQFCHVNIPNHANHVVLSGQDVYSDASGVIPTDLQCWKCTRWREGILHRHYT